MSDINRIDRFIEDTTLTDEEKGKILLTLRKLVLEINPKASEEIKYGGIVFNLGTELICGLFVRKKHISLEFSNGMSMSDPHNHLEGKGKYRRHLKFSNIKEVKSKHTQYYVTQALNTQN